MEKAKDQVLGLERWATRIHHDHNHLNDGSMDLQAKNPEEEDSGAQGGVLKLRKQLDEWHQAWVYGLHPHLFPTDNLDNPPNL
ncbi:hypothetical protein HAX54_027099 [Datura stramonium]|uniref:Uncharacterized protein n=1 Tax=Datura stramonium TaxID=4076 RepID=A0ABS8V4H2_DATST|nr:hypothetical protein [Datura stramonium]